MKKFLIGCLTVFVLLGAVGGFLAYRFVIRPVQGVVRNLEQLEQVGELNKRVTNTASFTVPSDGILQESQLNRYLAVQENMKASLSETVKELDEKYKGFDNEELTLSNVREFFGAYQDILKLVLEAKEVQVAALNEQNFSLQEYAWVKREALRAAALPFTQLDLSEFSGDLNIKLPELTQNIPEENIQLLEPYRENLEDVIGLAFFGL